MKVILATIIGLIVGNGVNLAIINFGMPTQVEAGVDQYEAMLEMMKSFTAMDYMIPLAAHVFGILVGLIIARLICKTSNVPIYIIGGLHMFATVINIFIIPAPSWFIVVDLILPILIILYFLRTKRNK